MLIAPCECVLPRAHQTCHSRQLSLGDDSVSLLPTLLFAWTGLPHAVSGEPRRAAGAARPPIKLPGASPGFALSVPALFLVGCACCHALVLADGVGQCRPDLLRELQFLFDVCDLIKKPTKSVRRLTRQALLASLREDVTKWRRRPVTQQALAIILNRTNRLEGSLPRKTPTSTSLSFFPGYWLPVFPLLCPVLWIKNQGSVFPGLGPLYCREYLLQTP